MHESSIRSRPYAYGHHGERGRAGRDWGGPENGLPVIYKFVNELPSKEVRKNLPWLAVISWAYDGSSRNGMPSEEVNASMLDPEHALDDLESKGICRHVYSRTGNSLKEFAYYIADRDQFIQALNQALRTHPAYPIEINFFEDPEWKDFRAILDLFTPAE